MTQPKSSSSSPRYLTTPRILVIIGLVMLVIGLVVMLAPGVITGKVDVWFMTIAVFFMFGGLFLMIIGYVLNFRREKSERKTAIDQLCEHLRQMGLNASVESKELKNLDGLTVLGSVRVTNRNVDLVELEWLLVGGSYGEYGSAAQSAYRCHYVVQARVDGFEDKLKAEFKPVMVKKGFLKWETIDFRWEGKELAQTLNNDADLKSLLYRADKLASETKVISVLPYREHQCVWIREEGSTEHPVSAFPTAQTFEAFDRIAHYVRSTANFFQP